MTSEGLGEMFEGDSADMCAEKDIGEGVEGLLFPALARDLSFCSAAQDKGGY